jgi:hypothetical protein
MGAILFLDEPIDGEESIDCEEVRIVGQVVWAMPDDGRETIIPLSNVTGVEGDRAEQYVEEIESPGGRFTELVTDLS